MKASVILPAYNEGKNIGEVIKAVKAGNYEIIVVDDGSVDNTLDIARQLDCTCVRFSRNIGKGAACIAGAKIASSENLVFMDSDGQLDAKEIPNMLSALKKCDLAVGTRPIHAMPAQRKISNSFARTAISAAAGKKLGDVLCGFRAIRRKDFLSLQLKKKRYEIEAEMVLKAFEKNFSIAEVPISVRYGVGSSMPIADSVKVAGYIMAELVSRRII